MTLNNFKSNIHWFFLVLFGFILLIGYNQCQYSKDTSNRLNLNPSETNSTSYENSGGGTDTGNPKWDLYPPQDSHNSDTSSNSNTTPSANQTLFNSFIIKICEVFQNCHNVLIEDCQSSMLNLNNMPDYLGLPADAYSNLQEVQRDLTLNKIIIDSINLNSCRQFLDSVNCYDDNIQNIYNKYDPKNFSGAISLIKKAPECGIFKVLSL